MTDEQDRWMDYAEFRGETIEALKSIHRELKDIKLAQIDLKKDFNEHRMSYDNLRIKLATIAGGVSALTSLMIVIIGRLI